MNKQTSTLMVALSATEQKSINGGCCIFGYILKFGVWVIKNSIVVC